MEHLTVYYSGDSKPPEAKTVHTLECHNKEVGCNYTRKAYSIEKEGILPKYVCPDCVRLGVDRFYDVVCRGTGLTGEEIRAKSFLESEQNGPVTIFKPGDPTFHYLAEKEITPLHKIENVSDRKATYLFDMSRANQKRFANESKEKEVQELRL